MNDLNISFHSIESNISLNNSVDLLKKHLIFRNFFLKEISDEIEFISNHFYETYDMLKENIDILGFDVIEKIIKNNKLQISCEDQLVSFINDIYIKNPVYSNLYSYVLFNNVSPEKLKEFIDIISFDHINISIWKSISNRLIENNYKKKKQKDELKKDDESRYKGIVFNREEGKEFNGIIKFIKDKIKFTASSIEENCIPENILYLDDWKYFHSQYNQNNWICIDFKENQIIPNSYEIKSYPFGINEQHPKSWVIEASNNKISWFVVDEI